MPESAEPRFNWRGVILIAIAFVLIGLAVLFQAGSAGGISVDLKQLIPTLSGLKAFGAVFVTGFLLLLAAFLGSLCGYMRVVFRLRKDSRARSQGAATPKI